MTVRYFLFENLQLISCTDELTEAQRAAYIDKAVYIQGRVEYFQEQITAIDEYMQETNALRETITEEEFADRMREAQQARYEQERNLANDSRMLSVMERNLSNNNIPAQSSSLGKRAGDTSDLPRGTKR